MTIMINAIQNLLRHEDMSAWYVSTFKQIYVFVRNCEVWNERFIVSDHEVIKKLWFRKQCCNNEIHLRWGHFESDNCDGIQHPAHSQCVHTGPLSGRKWQL